MKIVLLKSTTLLLLAVLLISAVDVEANEIQKWYKMEMLIFKQNNQDDEFEYRELDLQWPKPIVNITADKRFTITTKGLLSANKKLAKKWGYRVLWHQAWYQQGLDKVQSPWVMVQGGYDKFNRTELEGAFKIYLSRYFHIQVNLWFNQFGEQETVVDTQQQLQAIPQPNWPLLPEIPRIINNRDCPPYASLPLLMRKQLYSIRVTLNAEPEVDQLRFNPKPIAQLRGVSNEKSSDVGSVVDGVVDDSDINDRVIDELFANFAQKVLLDNKEGQLYCELSLDVDNIVNPITQEVDVVDQLLKIQLQQELKQYLFVRQMRTKTIATIADNLQRFLENPEAVQYSSQIPIDNISLMQQSQRILINKLYYIDHPKVGIILTINPVDKDTVEFNGLINQKRGTQRETDENNP